MNNPTLAVVFEAADSRKTAASPGVMAPALYRPLIHYALDAASALAPGALCVAAGPATELRGGGAGLHELDLLQEGEVSAELHARLERLGGEAVFIRADLPLLSAATLKKLLHRHAENRSICTIATTAGQPEGKARVIADGYSVAGVRREADCTEYEKQIREADAGVYCFSARALAEVWPQLRHGALHDTLLDGVQALAARGLKVSKFRLNDASEALAADSLPALAEIESLMRRRINHDWMLKGVAMRDPQSTLIDPRTTLERGVVLEAGVCLIASTVAAGVRIESYSRVVDSAIGKDTVVKQGSYIEKSRIGRGCAVGPYAHVRPGTEAGDAVRIGNFVEVKNSVIGDGSKASHLSYIGDAEIGRKVNIGCGFITCNYDGTPEKKRTVIGDEAFIGSDSQAIAPVTVGARSFIACGTSVSEDVPADAFVISRGRQTTKPGYAKRFRRPQRAPAASGSKAAEQAPCEQDAPKQAPPSTPEVVTNY